MTPLSTVCRITFAPATKRRENGNVLFLILIAVALFAALSYAVTSSSRSGGGNASNEKAVLSGSGIIQYGTAIDTALQRMRIITGKQVWEFDYSDLAQTVDALDNTNCADNSCRLFNVKGGQVSNIAFGTSLLSPAYLTAYPSSKNPYISFRSITVLNVGTADPELVLIIEGLNMKMCETINEKLNGFTSVPAQVLGTQPNYSGPLTDFPAASEYSLGSDATQLVGTTAGCFEPAVGAGWATYYQVLLAR